MRQIRRACTAVLVSIAMIGTSGCGHSVHVHFNNGPTKVRVVVRRIEPQALSGTAPGAEPADIAEPEGRGHDLPTGRRSAGALSRNEIGLQRAATRSGSRRSPDCMRSSGG